MKKDRKVVITGLGIIAPGANDKNEFWDNLVKGKNNVDIIKKTNVDCLRIKVGGEVSSDFDPERQFAKRFLKKCDDFSIYSLSAVKQALDDACLDIGKIDPFKIGIYIGNNYGGLKESQIGLTALYKEGREFVSPYLASNWFPAAPQGHVSIQFGIKGHSKTAVADMASSNIAIGNAYKLIVNGTVDYMIAGGTEAPLTTWGIIFYEKSGKFSFKSEDTWKIYQPFGKDRDGLVLAEGAAYLVLETMETAVERNAHIYGEIAGFGSTNDGVDYLGCDENGIQYARSIAMALDDQKIIPDYVSLNGTALEHEDNSEVNGLNVAFGKDLDDIACSCPKAFYGNTYGASGAMDAVIACLSMESSLVVKTGNVTDKSMNVNFNLVTKNNLEKELKSSLVMSKGLGGINSALLIKKTAI
jgi:3-oxoacyl-[acyl-carrier-protein] synthase II